MTNEMIKGIMSNWETAKEYIRPRLYNKAKAEGVYKSAAFYGFDDLVIVPYAEFDAKGGKAAVKVTPELIWHWGVPEEDVYKAAEANATGYEFIDMASLIPFMAEMPMWVATNADSYYGAYAAIVLRDEIKAKFPDGYIAIPSSVHEFIIVPKDAGDNASITEMIGAVNAAEVATPDQLGTHPYFF